MARGAVAARARRGPRRRLGRAAAHGRRGRACAVRRARRRPGLGPPGRTPGQPGRRRRAARRDPGRGLVPVDAAAGPAGRRPRRRRRRGLVVVPRGVGGRCALRDRQHGVRPGGLGEPGQPRGEAAAARPRVRRPRAWAGCSSRPTSATRARSRRSPGSARGTRACCGATSGAPTARCATPCSSRSPPRSGRPSGAACLTGCGNAGPGLTACGWPRWRPTLRTLPAP